MRIRSRQEDAAKEKDLSQRAGEEFDRSNICPETVPSSYEIEVHPSVDSIPSEMRELFNQMNKDISNDNECYREYQIEHLNKSKEAILDLAQIALSRVPEGQSKKALLLGVGNALDIPLPELVEMFDHLTVVELDRETTENAIKQLSPSLQAKIKLVEADISGILGLMSSEWQENIQNAESEADFFHGVIATFNRAAKNANAPDLGNDYAFVCSQLVLSQLGGIPHLYLKYTMNTKIGLLYGSCANAYKTMEDFLEDKGKRTITQEIDKYLSILPEYRTLHNNMKKAHINYLDKSVSRQGIVYLADASQVNHQGKLHNIVDSQFLKDAIEAHFVAMKDKISWDFKQCPIQTFRVESYCLQSKE